VHSKGFRISHPQRNVMGQSTEMAPLVIMFFRTFLNPFKFLMKFFCILVMNTDFCMMNSGVNWITIHPDTL